MNTVSQIIKELKKGCRRNYGFTHPKYCGDMGTEKRLLCEECVKAIETADKLLGAVEDDCKLALTFNEGCPSCMKNLDRMTLFYKMLKEARRGEEK